MKITLVEVVVWSFILCFAVEAQTVKITPLGSRTGEACAQDRGFLFEDPTGVRILYDPGVPVAGGADSRLGDVHAILLTHAHRDHLGDVKLNQDPDAAAAGCLAADVRTAPAQKSNLAEIAVAKNSAVISGFLLTPFLAGQIQSLRGVPTPGCPSTGRANVMTVPLTSPCNGGLNFGGKRMITSSSGNPGVQVALVPAQHENNVIPDFLDNPFKTNLAGCGKTADLRRIRNSYYAECKCRLLRIGVSSMLSACIWGPFCPFRRERAHFSPDSCCTN